MDDSIESVMLFELVSEHALLLWRSVVTLFSGSWAAVVLAVAAAAVYIIGSCSCWYRGGPLNRCCHRLLELTWRRLSWATINDALALCVTPLSALYRQLFSLSALALCPPLETAAGGWRWRGRHAACVAVQGARASMEDTFCCEEAVALSDSLHDVCLYGVFDGHGGIFAADYCRQHMLPALKQQLLEAHSQAAAVLAQLHHSPLSSTSSSSTTTSSGSSGSGSFDSLSGSSCSDSVASQCDTSAATRLSGNSDCAATAAVSQSVCAAASAGDGGSSPPPAERGAEASDCVSVSSADPQSHSLVHSRLLSDRYSVNGHVPLPPAAGAAAARAPGGHQPHHHLPQSDRRQLVSRLGRVNYDQLMQLVFAAVDARLLRQAAAAGAAGAGCVAGCTAVVVLWLRQWRRLVVAGCGDSRAVGCDLAGRATPLTVDHTPNLREERRRILAAGGTVQHCGVWRVNGCLAVSRALGDLPLKQSRVVTCQPHVTCVDLSSPPAAAAAAAARGGGGAADGVLQFVLVASDGLWDTVDCEQACRTVRHRLHEPQQALHALVTLALRRGSSDNITALLIDLRPHQ